MHPVLVVNNVKLYHSHAYSATTRPTPQGFKASVSVQFFNPEGSLYQVTQLWTRCYVSRSWARFMAELRFNGYVRKAREGIFHPEVQKEMQRCFNMSR